MPAEVNFDSESVRKAYRREAKKSHPDSSGSAISSERFRKVEEAYQTLGDSRKREAYDKGQPERRSPPFRAEPPPRPWRAPVSQRPPFSPASEPGRRASCFPFASAGAPEPLLEILLSREEALRGVELPVAVPVSLPCPECRTGGFWQRMFCFTCGGAGSIRLRQQLVANIPPGMQSGREFLLDTGDHPPGAVRVRVLVE